MRNYKFIAGNVNHIRICRTRYRGYAQEERTVNGLKQAISNVANSQQRERKREREEEIH